MHKTKKSTIFFPQKYFQSANKVSKFSRAFVSAQIFHEFSHNVISAISISVFSLSVGNPLTSSDGRGGDGELWSVKKTNAKCLQKLK
jgi:hypothetical protein